MLYSVLDFHSSAMEQKAASLEVHVVVDLETQEAEQRITAFTPTFSRSHNTTLTILILLLAYLIVMQIIALHFAILVRSSNPT